MSVIMIVHVIEDRSQRGMYRRELCVSRHVHGNICSQLQTIRGRHDDDDYYCYYYYYFGGGGGYDDDDDDNNNNNNNNNNKGNINSKVVPLIIVATGTISKSLRKCLSNIPGNHEIKKLQKKRAMYTYYGKC